MASAWRPPRLRIGGASHTTVRLRLAPTSEWEAQKAAYAAEAERQRKLEAATVALLQPGDTASERQFNYQAGERSFSQRILGRSGRFGATWFRYDLPVDPAHPMSLVVTY